MSKADKNFPPLLQLLTSYHCQYCTASGDLSSTGGCVGRSCSGLKASSPACPGALQLYKPLGVAELCLHGSPAGFLFPAFAGGNSLGCRYLGLCLGTGFYFGVAVLKSEQCKREISLAVVLLNFLASVSCKSSERGELKRGEFLILCWCHLAVFLTSPRLCPSAPPLCN